MTRTPPRPVDEDAEPQASDIEMSDAESTRGLRVARGRKFGPRPYPSAQHPHAQSSVHVATTAASDTHPDTPCRIIETREPQYPLLGRAQQQQRKLHDLGVGQGIPESPTVPDQTPLQTSDPAAGDPRTHEVELELRRRIADLETDLANRPTQEIVRELQRTIDTETAGRQRLQAEIARRTTDLEDLRKRWKQAARELDKARSQSQGFYQVTDNYLIDQTTQLRYNIRNFAIQYFGGELRKGRSKFETKPAYWDKYMMPTTPGDPLGCEVLMMSPERRPSVVQAFLWRFLVGHVFDQFRWAADYGIDLRSLCRLLSPEGRTSDAKDGINPDEERKFQTWVASTTSLVIDALNTPSRSRSADTRTEIMANKVRDVLDPFVVVDSASYEHELGRILEEALTLDREICRQIARIEWVFPQSDGKEVLFDSVRMRLGTGEGAAKGPEPQIVSLVVCPGMKKRGKSTGEDFTVESLLVSMEVSCEAIPAPGGEGRGRRWFM